MSRRPRRTSPARPAPPAPPALDPRAQRALGGESRLRILEALRAGGPLDAEGISSRVGLHLNTVRTHLEVLRDAGLVATRPLPGTGPGRPRLVFSATRSVPSGGPPGADRLLAEILTAALLSQPDGPERARLAGRAAGLRLAGDAPGGRETEAERRQRVLDLLDRWGFGPHADGERSDDGSEVVALHHCPYRELAEAAAPVVCSAHRGVLEGAVEGLGGTRGAVALLPMVSPGLCLVHLRQAATTAAAEAPRR